MALEPIVRGADRQLLERQDLERARELRGRPLDGDEVRKLHPGLCPKLGNDPLALDRILVGSDGSAQVSESEMSLGATHVSQRMVRMLAEAKVALEQIERNAWMRADERVSLDLQVLALVVCTPEPLLEHRRDALVRKRCVAPIYAPSSDRANWRA